LPQAQSHGCGVFIPAFARKRARVNTFACRVENPLQGFWRETFSTPVQSSNTFKNS
jgi:hypothetical protein